MLTRLALFPVVVLAGYLPVAADAQVAPPPPAPPTTNQAETGKVLPAPTAPLPPQPAPVVDDGLPSLHGFADVALKNFYATPRGLLVTDKGYTIQLLDGLVLDFAQSPNDLVSDVAFAAGTWTDFNPGYQAPNSNGVNEVDYFAGLTATVATNFKAGVQYVDFVSPQRAFHVEHNIEFSLAFDDSSYLKPLSIQPYAKIFYAVAGSSTVVTGSKGNTFDAEIGAVPKLDLHPYSIPIILTAPSWFTVGPASYWGGTSNFGVVSVGLKATYPLTMIPASFGHWYVDTGIQFYHELNSQLLLAQTFVGTAQPGTNEHRNFGIWSVGFGMGF
jgi:hypothetical protein